MLALTGRRGDDPVVQFGPLQDPHVDRAVPVVRRLQRRRSRRRRTRPRGRRFRGPATARRAAAARRARPAGSGTASPAGRDRRRPRRAAATSSGAAAQARRTGHAHLLRADTGHLGPQHPLDLVQHQLAEGQPGVHARGEAADVPAADQQPRVRGISVGRILAQVRRNSRDRRSGGEFTASVSLQRQCLARRKDARRRPVMEDGGGRLRLSGVVRAPPPRRGGWRGRSGWAWAAEVVRL